MKKWFRICAAACAALLTCVATHVAEAQSSGTWKTASFSGNEIRYFDTGSQKAQALVFIHGWSCDSSFWRLQFPAFADFRLIAVDLPGFGRSAKPQDIAYTLEFFARAVHAVTQDAGIASPVLIGHSMGYAVSRQYLMLYPDAVKAVVNVDGAYFRIPPTREARDAFEREVGAMLAAHEGPERPKAVHEFVESTFYGKTPEKLRAEIMKEMSSADPYAATSALREMLRLDQWAERSFDVPSLALYATNAYLPSDHGSYLKTVFPNLVYEEWDNAGHYLMLEQPDRFNATLRSYLETLGK